MTAARPSACLAPADPGGLRLSAEALLAWRRGMLAIDGIDAARPGELDWLLDLAGGLSSAERHALWLDPKRPVTLRQPLSQLEQLWRRHRRNAEPLQHLAGRCPWRDLVLEVSAAALIPRQETELLVDLALDLAPAPPVGQPLRWADLGTGCGAVAIALARALPGSIGVAVDVSRRALRQARRNRTALLGRDRSCASSPVHGQLSLGWGDWWQAIPSRRGPLQLVVSNPPYIPSEVCSALDPVVRLHEPLLALDGGVDGLQAIRTIVAGAPRRLAPGGVLLLEHHHDQGESVRELLQAGGLVEVQAHRDLEGVQRFASGRRPLQP